MTRTGNAPQHLRPEYERERDLSLLMARFVGDITTNQIFFREYNFPKPIHLAQPDEHDII